MPSGMASLGAGEYQGGEGRYPQMQRFTKIVKKLLFSLYIWEAISVEKSIEVPTPQEIKNSSKLSMQFY